MWCCVGRNAITDTGAVGTLSAPDSGQGHAHGARTLESGHVSEKVRKSQQGQHALSSPRPDAGPLSGRKDRSVIRSNLRESLLSNYMLRKFESIVNLAAVHDSLAVFTNGHANTTVYIRTNLR